MRANRKRISAQARCKWLCACIAFRVLATASENNKFHHFYLFPLNAALCVCVSNLLICIRKIFIVVELVVVPLLADSSDLRILPSLPVFPSFPFLLLKHFALAIFYSHKYLFTLTWCISTVWYQWCVASVGVESTLCNRIFGIAPCEQLPSLNLY